MTNIILYNNKADSIILDKSSRLEKQFEFVGTFRNEISVINPIILIEVVDDIYNINVIDNTGSNIVDTNLINIVTKEDRTRLATKCNYIYIEEFDRYYYITDVVCVRNDLYELHCKVDVLMTFKKDIIKLDAFVTRNEFDYNDLVKDDYVPFNYDKQITEYEPIKGNFVNFEFISDLMVQENNYAVTVINDLSGTSYDLVIPPMDMLPKVGGWVAGNTAMSITYATYPAQITRLAKRIIGNDNLASFIISIMCYPFKIPSKPEQEFLTLGSTELGGPDEVVVYKLEKQCSEYLVLADFELKVTEVSFLSYAPYSQYELYIPYLGWITLDPNECVNKRLVVIYTVDYRSGSAQVSVINKTDNRLIFTSTTQLGVRIPINSTNATEVNNNRLSNNIGLGLGLTASVLAAAGGIATLNPIVTGGAVLSGANAISNFVTSNNTNYSRASGTIGSSQSGVYLPQKVRVRITNSKYNAYKKRNYAKLFGKPLNYDKNLSELKGKTVVGEVRLDNIDGATKNELDEIKSLLNTGIIL